LILSLSLNNGWYEGICNGNIPSTDNGLESLNGKIESKNILKVLNEGQGTIRKDKNDFLTALKEYQN
jgi:hypothetical protein